MIFHVYAEEDWTAAEILIKECLVSQFYTLDRFSGEFTREVFFKSYGGIRTMIQLKIKQNLSENHQKMLGENTAPSLALAIWDVIRLSTGLDFGNFPGEESVSCTFLACLEHFERLHRAKFPKILQCSNLMKDAGHRKIWAYTKSTLEAIFTPLDSISSFLQLTSNL